MNRAVAYQTPSVHRAHPEHGKGSAGTRMLSSKVSEPSSLASSPAVASRHRPYGKGPSGARSHGEDNGHGKHRPASKKTAPDGSKRSVHCPFKVRFPDDRKFVSCPAFHDWGRLREHLVDRRHKPKDLCQNCGSVFEDDVKWSQHTTACTMRGGAWSRPICVERDQVPLIRRLTSKGRQRRPIEDLYRELWTILFGKDVPLPDSIAWLIANSSRNSVEEVPRNIGRPSDFGVSNQALHSGYIAPAQLQAPIQPPTMNSSDNSYSASAIYSTSTTLHSRSTEISASQRNTQGSSSWWPSEFDPLGSPYSLYEDGNDLRSARTPYALDNPTFGDVGDWDLEAFLSSTGNSTFNGW